jgi:uncharacterized protein (DUF305 family)
MKLSKSLVTHRVFYALISTIIIGIIGVYFVSKNNNDLSITFDKSKPKHGHTSNLSKHGRGSGAVRFTSWTDKTFLEHMIPHHEEAVESSKTALSKTKNDDLKGILQDIIDVQTQEIIYMKDWYSNWFGIVYSDKNVYTPLMVGLDSYTGEIYDREWMQSMIYHHEAAIYMSKDGKSTVKEEELKELMNSIIISQTKQIQEMEDLIIKNRAKKS